MKLRILSCFWLLLMAGLVHSEDIELNPSHPERYTVVRGDTLWDIAGKFLAKPWQWPAIWRENPHIPDPHWIYPGDELVLTVVDGQPSLQVAHRSFESRPEYEKLEPTIRIEPLDRAIPTIPLDAIQQFLTQTKVVGPGDMENSPYVVALADEHVVGGAGDRIYVRGLDDSPTTGYMIFRGGKPYTDFETGAILGYDALYVGDVEREAGGDPATMLITRSDRDVYMGDRILPIETERLDMHYQPHSPAGPVRGHIISVLDGVSQIGQYQIVVIDRGMADGIETGHVLEIRTSGRIQRDPFSPFAEAEVHLPEEKEGHLMVFRPYERISFALIMRASRAIHLYDAVVNP